METTTIMELTERQQDVVAWATDNGMDVVEDEPTEGDLTIEIPPFRKLIIEGDGTIRAEAARELATPESELHAGERQLTIKNPEDTNFHISNRKFPF